MTDSDDLFGRIRKLKERAAAASGPSIVDRFVQEIHRKRALVQALDTFIQNIYFADGLTPAESQKNIAESLVEIRYYRQHSSNGILVTDDGYFLTALHCVQNSERHPLEQARIQVYNGNSYPIEKICASAKKEDLALVKAVIPKECKPRNYRFYNTNVLCNDRATLLARRDGKLSVRDGSITRAKYKTEFRIENEPEKVYTNHFFTDFAAIPGDSGGVILSIDGRVAGLVCGGNYQITSGVKIIQGLKLIEAYKRRISESI
ncbi:trypsin-like peptidase domain-containing protein [Candidatus Woesearchaeota archaeon]|nr:trypsin-like peptidase domain-containing protein [Candidatus Woesearchaeota archaeon]